MLNCQHSHTWFIHTHARDSRMTTHDTSKPHIHITAAQNTLTEVVKHSRCCFQPNHQHFSIEFCAYRPTLFCSLGRASRNSRVNTAWGAMLHTATTEAGRTAGEAMKHT